MGGIDPARELLLDALKNGRSVVSANKALLAEEGEALAERGARVGRRPLLRGLGGGRDPAAAPHPAVPGRRPHPPGRGHRQRHHQLHPLGDGVHRRGLRRRARGGRPARATPRPTPPPTSTATTPPPRPRSSRASPSTPGSPPPTSTARASATSRATDIASARALGCSDQAAGDLRAGRDAPSGASVSARVYPAMIPRSHPLASVVGRLQRRVRRGRRRRAADVLRPGRGRAPDGERGARRPRGRGPQQGHRRPRPARLGLRRPADPADGRRPHPLPRRTSTCTDRAGVLAAVAAVFAEHDVSIATVKQEGGRASDADLRRG